MSKTFPPTGHFTIEEAAKQIASNAFRLVKDEKGKVIDKQKIRDTVTTKTVRNYINNGLIDAKREINPNTGRVVWLISEASISELPNRLKKRDEALLGTRRKLMLENRRPRKND